MIYDASRVSANIPSGVGFLGAGLIWKGDPKVITGTDGQPSSMSAPQIKGLTTAASAWLSAAVGVSCGGGLYAVAIFTSLLVTVVLKHGPKRYDPMGREIRGFGNDPAQTPKRAVGVGDGGRG